MARRLLLLLAVVALTAAPALAGDGYGDKKAKVDAKLSQLQSKIAAQRAQEQRLGTQIRGLTSQIKTLELQVGDVSSKLTALQNDLDLHQRRLDKLNALFHIQTLRYRALERSYRLAVERLDLRLVSMYKQNEPSAVDVVLAARNMEDVLSQLDYLGAVAKQDKRVAFAVADTKRQVKLARAKTADARTGVAQETRVIHARTMQQALLRGQLLRNQDQLATARSGKSHDLVITKAQVQDEIDESNALAQSSAALAAKIRDAEAQSAAAAAAGTETPAPEPQPNSGGLAWPVSAPITSPFGYRWGVLHAGIDLGAPYGAPIHAAGSGTVVWCGWMSGYGNLVMIDHHNGLATAYGHQSRIAVGCNEQVSQGQVIGYVGSTGHSTGPHLHFEVRLHGTPVDPLGYLP
jgi:murein DD-endopeptidase MepM/ murein hydrolase activator NlpD